MLNRLARFLIKLIMRLISQIQVNGMENVPQSGAFIVASNHLGRLDVPLVYMFLNRPDITILVAEKYRHNFIIRWFVRHLDALFIDRFGADLVTVRAALNRLRKGGVLVIAPEGTRSPTGALIEARSGASYLAAKAGAPIFPVAITGTEDRQVLQRLKHLQRAQIQVTVGKPFSLPPLNHKDRETELEEYTTEIMCQIAALLPPAKRGFYANFLRTRELLTNSN
jgi:1-acyl-sn-glycerol-3-phosphate acyltransferase